MVGLEDDVGSRDVVHAHGGSHQRHIVDHRREDADDEVDEEEAGGFGTEGVVEATGKATQDAGHLKAAHGHQDAEEEEDGGSVDMLQRGDGGRQLVAFFLIFAADDFGGEPQHGQAEEHAQIGRQMGDGLEDGDENQCGDTHE